MLGLVESKVLDCKKQGYGTKLDLQHEEKNHQVYREFVFKIYFTIMQIIMVKKSNPINNHTRRRQPGNHLDMTTNIQLFNTLCEEASKSQRTSIKVVN